MFAIYIVIDQMHVAEMEMNKAKNMIDHKKEICSRPARVWFQQNDTDKRKRQNQREQELIVHACIVT